MACRDAEWGIKATPYVHLPHSHSWTAFLPSFSTETSARAQGEFLGLSIPPSTSPLSGARLPVNLSAPERGYSSPHEFCTWGHIPFACHRVLGQGKVHRLEVTTCDLGPREALCSKAGSEPCPIAGHQDDCIATKNEEMTACATRSPYEPM
jgi:hypothetical protein